MRSRALSPKPLLLDGIVIVLSLALGGAALLYWLLT